MGNAAASCAPSIICSSTGVVKVMFGDGTLEIYTRPVKAAELMLENPGHFVCDSSHLKVGHRIPGLLAEEELDSVNRRHGQQRLYFLLPMEMLYSVLTNEELTSLNRKASKALKQQGHQGGGGGIGYLSTFPKIFPASFGEFCLFPNNHSETDKTTSGVTTTAVSNSSGTEPVTRQRSWIPALETIVETPPRRLIG